METKNEGSLDLGNIDEVRANLDKMHSIMIEADHEHLSRQLHFTERLMDEQKPGGKRAYILAHQLIGTAVENWDAVFFLLRGAEGATPVAPFDLIRPAFEAAFHALWILDAHDPNQRCMRGLRMAHEDNKQKKNWWLEVQKLPFLTPEQREEGRASVARAETAYRQVAIALGVQWSKVTVPLDSPRELANLSFVKSDS